MRTIKHGPQARCSQAALLQLFKTKEAKLHAQAIAHLLTRFPAVAAEAPKPFRAPWGQGDLVAASTADQGAKERDTASLRPLRPLHLSKIGFVSVRSKFSPCELPLLARFPYR